MNLVFLIYGCQTMVSKLMVRIVNDIYDDGLVAFNYNPLANTDDGSCEAIFMVVLMILL